VRDARAAGTASSEGSRRWSRRISRSSPTVACRRPTASAAAKRENPAATGSSAPAGLEPSFRERSRDGWRRATRSSSKRREAEDGGRPHEEPGPGAGPA